MTIKLEDLIPGGKADNSSLMDLAKKYAYDDSPLPMPK